MALQTVPRRNGLARERPTTAVSVARERIERLAALAREATRAGREDRGRTYVRRARRIAERNRLQLPRPLRRFSCDACDRYLCPGRNARVRTRSGHVVITCDCGAQHRYPYD
jgi:ribonuclease P protein subunit RPR2